MHIVRFIVIFVFFGLIQTARAQQPSSLDPGGAVSASPAPSSVYKKKKHKRKFFAPRKKAAQYRRPSAKHTPEYEFYDRVERAAKEKKKIIKKLYKPQFSDKRYFGHKKIPKRRKPHKMRYCDECGIRH